MAQMVASEKRSWQRVAYHEAGHAVMAWHSRSRRVAELVITPDHKGHGGLCYVGPPLFTDATIQAGWDVLIRCAGFAAEWQLLGCEPNHPMPRNDAAWAQHHARTVTRTNDDARKLVRECIDLARATLARPDRWCAVAAVAEALLARGRLRGREAEKLAHAAIFRACPNAR